MAEKKKTTTTKTTNRRSVWGINKISFYLLGAMAILYLIASILSLCGLQLALIGILQAFATAVALCIVGYIAWGYVRNTSNALKILYLVFMLVVLLGIILPMVF